MKTNSSPKRKIRVNGYLLSAIVLFVIGIGVISFPHFLQNQYTKNTSAVMKNFDQIMINGESNPEQNNESQLKKLDGLYDEIRNYNEKLYETKQEKLNNAYSYQKESINLSKYGIDNNMIGYVEIPSIDIRLPIYLGASSKNMKLGAAHLTETSLPIGGINTNCVICGHKGYYGAKLFKYLTKVKPGDEVSITNPWETLKYRVISTEIVLDNEIDKFKIQDGKDTVTLFTCYYQHNRKDRFVVFCEREM